MVQLLLAHNCPIVFNWQVTREKGEQNSAFIVSVFVCLIKEVTRKKFAIKVCVCVVLSDKRTRYPLIRRKKVVKLV